MQLPRRTFLQLAAAAAAFPAVLRTVWGQTYPTRPITIVVPYAPGGSTDTMARILAERMRVSLGQPVIIENVTGANGSMGVGRVARAPADGYTLSFGTLETNVFNGAIYALPYDALNDFTPVANPTSQPYVIIAKNALPASDLKQFITWLKANPNKALAGTAGSGSPGHIAGALFQKATGTRFEFVPYRGGAPAMQDLVAGQIDMIFNLAGGSLAQVRAGRIKIYAVMAKSRSSFAPDVPTVDEAGLPGLHMSSWTGLWAPKGTPRSIIARLNDAVVDALTDANARARLTELVQEITPPDLQTPDALAALQKAEIEKWWPIIKAANIKGE
jgi:tripartite-type tricarboxylate transporter receptor subunit TctC